MASNNLVAELVYTSLSVPPERYKDVYRTTLEPILLAQPGLISAMGGIITTGTESATAISLVVWESVDAHVAFISGPAAFPFFEASKPLMSGPPAVEHYRIGGLQTRAVQSRFSRLLKASDNEDKEKLAKILDKCVAAEGSETAVISNSRTGLRRLLMLWIGTRASRLLLLSGIQGA
ncbi:uncharacterized protein TRIREDRAFT_105524 [Trichoderma reesei QM6a]|uniref:Predicted protein n=1 Tax=Hypocrea jecorina (strain QM6a) TaxID=431241 RepID=G0REW8_HYPJQ|nr:uncharacterized protein TRIREDRAFT_105524 [Trichoderma reesei QM6a]EGR50412.1 predicted protein [Trichoderma reesei QM6a]